MIPSEEQFRKILGLFPTGVAVVTVSLRGEDSGITISSFTSLSLSPPQVLFCLSKKSKTMPIVEKASYFAVNILNLDQSHLSNVFAKRFPLDWTIIKTHRHAETGCLLLSEALGHVVCEKGPLYEGGDHKIVLGKVLDLCQSSELSPLIRQRGQYLTTQQLPCHENESSSPRKSLHK